MTLFRTCIATVLCISAIGVTIFSLSCSSGNKTANDKQVGMAAEFMNHAAAAYVAQERGMYEARGLKIDKYESFVSGMALASALSRGDIQVAYICLVPAINAHANAGISLKIVAGTHKYGYALVANREAVPGIEDLCKEGVRVGCVREGGAVDVLMNRAADLHRLDRQKLTAKIRRMNPAKMLLAIKAGQLDAAFLPEHWAAMAEDLGFGILADARELWPLMQGSVLVVKAELAMDNPDLVRALVAVNEEATRWINANPEESAETLSKALSVTAGAGASVEGLENGSKADISPATMLRSMKRMEYSTAISVDEVQKVIDYMAKLGYIRKSFPAGEIVDTRFME